MSNATKQAGSSLDCNFPSPYADAFASVSTPSAAAMAYFTRLFARCACACAGRAGSSRAGTALKAAFARLGRALAQSGASCCA